MIKPESIKQLVIDETRKLNGEFPTKEHLADLVSRYFPGSKWKDTHYAWYKSQIKRGLITINERSDINEDESSSDSDTNKEFSLSLERDLQSYLSLRLDEIEPGLELVEGGIEFKTLAGDIDILAKDSKGHYVVIELKAGKAKDSAIGQILGYIGALSVKDTDENIRGILVASDFEPRLYYASKSLKKLRLIKYNLKFSFTPQ